MYLTLAVGEPVQIRGWTIDGRGLRTTTSQLNLRRFGSLNL